MIKISGLVALGVWSFWTVMAAVFGVEPVLAVTTLGHLFFSTWVAFLGTYFVYGWMRKEIPLRYRIHEKRFWIWAMLGSAAYVAVYNLISLIFGRG